jgi:hypothetical protein
MTRKLLLTIVFAALASAALAAGTFKWGKEVGGRETLLLSARGDVLMDIHIGEYLHRHAELDAMSAIDAKINASVMEIDELSQIAPGEKTQSSAVLRAVAKYRRAYSDASGAISPSSAHVQDILHRYEK